jgi:hypothetical protein
MKIRIVEAELFHANGRTDGQTNMTKVILGFRNFANAPKDGCRLMKVPLENNILYKHITKQNSVVMATKHTGNNN